MGHVIQLQVHPGLRQAMLLHLPWQFFFRLPSGKQPHNYGKSQFFRGKFTINGWKTMENHHFSWEKSLFLWAMFNSKLLNYQRVFNSFLWKMAHFAAG